MNELTLINSPSLIALPPCGNSFVQKGAQRLRQTGRDTHHRQVGRITFLLVRIELQRCMHEQPSIRVVTYKSILLIFSRCYLNKLGRIESQCSAGKKRRRGRRTRRTVILLLGALALGGTTLRAKPSIIPEQRLSYEFIYPRLCFLPRAFASFSPPGRIL